MFQRRMGRRAAFWGGELFVRELLYIRDASSFFALRGIAC